MATGPAALSERNRTPHLSKSIIAVFSDTHGNSKLGLAPPSVTDDEGGTLTANPAQKWLWTKWLDLWKQVRQLKNEHQARLFVVSNGDLVDGDHHDSPQIMSRNLYTQQRIALALYQPILECEPDYNFLVRGTETHVGKSGQFEEFTAAAIAAEPNPETGTHSWWHLQLDIDGVLMDFAHHGRVGTRLHTKANAAMTLASEISSSCAIDGEKIPDLVFRSHRHQHVDTFDNYPARVIQTAGWQFPTAFVHRVAPGALPTFGGYIVIIPGHAGNKYDLIKIHYRPKRSEAWKPNTESNRTGLWQSLKNLAT